MSDYGYIIVGGGMTADAAAKGVREVDKSGNIAIFSEERELPYNRPPLSKSLWKGESVDSIWRATEKDLKEQRIDFFRSTAVVTIDVSSKTVKTSDEKLYRYEKLLLATGGKARRFPFGGDSPVYLRTLEDYTRLRTLSDRFSDFVVIGGGFIGSEIAAALAMNGKKVTIVFPDGGIGARVYPRGLSSFLNSYYEEKNVNVISDGSVVGIEDSNGRLSVKLGKGGTVLADAVVAGLGIVPNVELAKKAGITTDNGIIVDEYLRTKKPDIFAAGDVANFHSQALDMRMRVEHEDNANTMGKIAGHNLAGKMEPYHHIPFFYSDLFNLGYEAVGELDSSLEIFEDWNEAYKKGVVYYLRDGRVRGVLLWNTWGKVEDARELIISRKKFPPGSLKGVIAD
jgi:3-phenylpropionate/trans-cinnamate dioxygenase ferredoxin reductase subunit